MLMANKKLALAVGAAAVISAVVAVGYQQGYNSAFRIGKFEGRQAGEDRFDREWSDAHGDPSFSAQIADAQARWNSKVGLPRDHVDPARMPIVMAFSDQVCVKLKLLSGSIGGSPAYCYRAGSTELIKEDSDVE